ncbi:MAG: histone H1-like repetitive region-containing protein [Acidimicrobiales bacterium]
MSSNYVVVDGSNIATEGRSLPSLRQLDEAVRAFLAEHPADQLTVVVDATFGHRIDASEREEYEAAVLAGELVSPPAGAIGRGDAFVLQIADKADAMILSNDSFQEFHGQYGWLFDEGRLMGGKPVPGLGWVFLLRTPVRGPASRRSVKEARTGRRTGTSAQSDRSTRGRGRSEQAASGGARSAASSGGGRSRGPGRDQLDRSTEPSRRTRDRRPAPKSSEPLNDLLPFVDFVGAHPVGTEVEAVVDTFSSHGAYALVGDVRCYIPLKAMGDPPPLRARDALSVGETRTFTVTSIDAPRRGIDLALPAGSMPTRSSDVVSLPLPQGVPIGTVARQVMRDDSSKTPTRAVVTDTTSPEDDHAEEAPVTPVKKAPAKKAVAKKAPAKKAPAKKAPAKKAVAKKTVAKKAPAKKAVARKAPAKKTAAKKAPARKAPAKKAAAKKAPARKTAAKKAPARKAPAKRATAARKR